MHGWDFKLQCYSTIVFPYLTVTTGIPIVHPLQAFFVTIQKAILEGLLSGAGGGGKTFGRLHFNITVCLLRIYKSFRH